MSVSVRFFMSKEDNRKFINLRVAAGERAAAWIGHLAGKRAAPTEHERRVLRTASVLIGEMAAEEISKQCRFIVSRVLTKNEVKTVGSTLSDLLVAAASAVGTVKDNEAQDSTKTRVMKQILDVLTNVDDLYETGAWYQTDDAFGKKKFYVHENYDVRAALEMILRSIAQNRELMNELDSGLTHKILLVANRVNKALRSSRQNDHFTPLSDADFES